MPPSGQTTNPAGLGKIARLRLPWLDAGYNSAHDLDHETNSHISKKGDRHIQVRERHAVDNAAFNTLSQREKDMYHYLEDHWRKMYNDKHSMVIHSMVEDAVDSGKWQMPRGASKKDYEDFIFSGAIDKDDAQLTPFETQLKESMGKNAEDIQNLSNLRKIKGVYVPFRAPVRSSSPPAEADAAAGPPLASRPTTRRTSSSPAAKTTRRS
jgi:hypothetical protein